LGVADNLYVGVGGVGQGALTDLRLHAHATSSIKIIILFYAMCCSWVILQVCIDVNHCNNV
jgi:hypothetical protein